MNEDINRSAVHLLEGDAKKVPAADRFIECLQEVEKVSQALQQALVKRKPEAIWQAIELQEESMSKFAACYHEYTQSRAGKVQENVRTSSDSLIQDMIRRIKSIHRTNKGIAQAFLDVIDRTISGIGLMQGGNAYVYDASGRVGQSTSPILVQERG
ncbi:MAG: hypothetical protein V2A34_16405 [Lentisphaerota bacterium]